MIAQAQSGTGKTATFAIGCLQQLDYSLNQCQALILAPTRELASQIQKVVDALGDYLGVRAYACIGGTRVRDGLPLARFRLPNRYDYLARWCTCSCWNTWSCS